MIKCSNCKKRFDEKKYYRLCPKCGIINSKNQQDVNSSGSLNYKESGMLENDQFKTKFEKEPKIKKSSTTIAIGFVFILILITIIYFKVQIREYEKEIYEVATTFIFEVETVEQGANFLISRSNITVDHCKEIDVPELLNHKMNFDVILENKIIGIYIESRYADYKGDYRESGETPYLKFVEDDFAYYRQNIYAQDSEILAQGEKLISRYEVYGEEEGYLLFSVDKDVTEVTIVFEQTLEKKDVDVIEKKYEITLPVEAIGGREND